MRLHWKKGPMMHHGGHHHLKRKHMLLRSTSNEDDLLCKKKHFKRMMKGRPPGFHGKWKHFKGMRGHTSSDSDDSHHHHGKGKHFKRMMKGRSSGGHHSNWKHYRGSSSDSDDDHHGKGMHGWMSSPERNHRHGKEKHFKKMQGRLGDEGMQRRCMSDTEGGRHHRGMHFLGRRGGPMDNLEGHHGKGEHSKGIQGMSCPDDEEMQGHCMSDNEGHHHGRMHFMGRQRRPMSDSEGHHGKEKHSKDMPCSDDERMQRRCMSDNERHHYGRRHFIGRQGRLMTDHHGHHGKHMRGMMHHHKGKHWMKGRDRRGFFDDDSALVPICIPEAEGCPETLESENTGNQATEAAEVVAEDTTRTKNQETQTSGIMEIVIEDQEALTAAIRIVNKFL